LRASLGNKSLEGVGMLHYRAYLLDEHRHVITGRRAPRRPNKGIRMELTEEREARRETSRDIWTNLGQTRDTPSVLVFTGESNITSLGQQFHGGTNEIAPFLNPTVPMRAEQDAPARLGVADPITEA
jgi:hypothetical protein